MAKSKSAIQQQLTVQRRPAQGSRPVKRLRAEGVVPGVVYGKDVKPLAVSINRRELVRLLQATAGEHPLVTLKLQDTAPWEKPVLVKEIQYDPVDGHVLHVDFHAIVLTERLRVRVPLVLKGEPVGVKQDGGILEHFLREVEVECLPADMPSSVEFDVTGLQLGQTVHVRDLGAPKNAKITTDPDGAVASVLAPKEEKPEEEAPTSAEPEVLREKKPEAEEAAGEAAKGAGGVESRSSEPKKDAKS